MKCVKCGAALIELRCSFCGFDITSNELHYACKLSNEEILQLTEFIQSASGEGIYEGEYKNGKRHGFGKCTYATGVVYIGDWKDGKQNGYVKVIYTNGDVFEGEYKDGEENGHGKGTFANGDVFEGEFKDGKQNGHGKGTFASGDVFEGEYKDGKRNGHGKYTFANGDVFEGEYKDGEENGHGKYTFANGDVFEGTYKDGKCNNRGKVTYANGDVYEGEWNNGKRNGSGKFTHANYIVYEGEWKDDVKCGQGKETNSAFADTHGVQVYEGQWKDNKKWGIGKETIGNQIYDGEWEDGRHHGYGKMTFSNGDIYEGEWKNGKQDGPGKLTYANGAIHEGEWKCGQPKGKGKFTRPDGTVVDCIEAESASVGKAEEAHSYNNAHVNNQQNNSRNEDVKSANTNCSSTGDKQENHPYRVRFENGDYYTGEGGNGWRNGYGKLIYANGDIYEGEWKQNQRVGQGKLTYANGDVYEGQFIKDRHGRGKLTKANGKILEGEWRNDEFVTIAMRIKYTMRPLLGIFAVAISLLSGAFTAGILFTYKGAIDENIPILTVLALFNVLGIAAYMLNGYLLENNYGFLQECNVQTVLKVLTIIQGILYFAPILWWTVSTALPAGADFSFSSIVVLIHNVFKAIPIVLPYIITIIVLSHTFGDSSFTNPFSDHPIGSTIATIATVALCIFSQYSFRMLNGLPDGASAEWYITSQAYYNLGAIVLAVLLLLIHKISDLWIHESYPELAKSCLIIQWFLFVIPHMYEAIIRNATQTSTVTDFKSFLMFVFVPVIYFGAISLSTFIGWKIYSRFCK